jgi:hypothetical protein
MACISYKINLVPENRAKRAKRAKTHYCRFRAKRAGNNPLKGGLLPCPLFFALIGLSGIILNNIQNTTVKDSGEFRQLCA